MKITKEIHIWTTEEKIQRFGNGEWVQEIDYLEFEYLDYECTICRMCVREPYSKEEKYFGGYLCGYVKLPKYHPYYDLEYYDMRIICHGGLTFGEKNEQYWIGFDCSHSHDYIPSFEFLKETAPFMAEFKKKTEELKKRFNLENSPIFNRIYRNMEFCIYECKNIIDQLIEIQVTNMIEKSTEESLMDNQ